MNREVQESKERYESAEADVIGCAVVVRDTRRRNEPANAGHRGDPLEYAVLALCMAVDLRELRREEYLAACAAWNERPVKRAQKESPS